MRRVAGGMENAAHFAAFVNAAAIENENVAEGNHVAFHSRDLGNGDDFARTVGETGDLDDGVDCACDLMANGALGNVQVGHRHHIFNTSQGVARGVGVDGGERALVAGVHGLQHVECFFTAHLADHDAVGTHTQAVDDELAHADRALAFDVGRASFETDDVFLLELQFGCVFDGDDALGIRNVSGEDVENGGFAGAGASGNDHIEAALDHGREQFQHGFGQGFVVEHVARGDGIAAKAANRETGAIERQRRNDGVDARAILQAGIDHGRRFIDAAADARHDAVDDLHEVLVVFERQAGDFELASALDVDAVEAVDENVGNGGIFEQRFEWAQAKNFVEDLARQLLALGKAKRNRLAVDRTANEDENFLARRISSGAAEFFEIEAIENLAMQVRLNLLVLGPFEGL